MINKEKIITILPSVFLYLICAVIFSLSVFAIIKYPGQGYVYIIFTLISNLLLYFGFRKKAIFFDTFIGVFFWLGFWLKLTVRVGLLDGIVNQGVSNFDGSGIAFDRALLVTTCAFIGLLLASYVREKLIFNYPTQLEDTSQPGLYSFYVKHRWAILIGFMILFLTVAVSNVFLGIYQRGEIPKTVLPFGLGGIYTWLLLFGLTSFSALILKFEMTMRKETSSLVVLLSLLENFASNVSLLSRGMLLNAGALFYGLYKYVKIHSIKSGLRFFLASIFIFLVLFASSIKFVNHIRSDVFLDTKDAEKIESMKNPIPLFIDRWVGIEGVTAVSSYPDLGWDLWSKAWEEKYSENKTSFYDMNLIVSSYKDTDMTKHHFVSLPGIVAFCFYPGSYLFLFGCLFLLGCFAALIEIVVFKFGGKNLILCALLSQVVAFRFSSFGYVPGQSYLLLATILINVGMIFFADKILIYFYKTRATI